MKKTLLFTFFAVSLIFATMSCEPKKEKSETETADMKLIPVNTDSTFENLLKFMGELKDLDAINKDKKKLIRVEELEAVLKELNHLNIGDRKAFLKDSSGFILYEEFIKRRQTFKDSMAFLIRKKTFPTYFHIDRWSFDSLYRVGQQPANIKTKMAVRMYPVWDGRFKDATEHSWAFMWADTSDHSMNQFNTRTIIMDIINPCPPPHDCH